MGLIAVAAGTLALAADKVALPIEAYVAPPSIFPKDGKFTKDGAKAYKPFPAHARPDGPLVGHVATNYLTCGPDCEMPKATFVALDGKRQPLDVQTWFFSTAGLAAYDAPVVTGSIAWTKIRFTQGAFWIKTAKKDVHLYEPLSNFADNFDTVCTKLGTCQPVTAAMRKNIAGIPFDGCVGNPYEVRKVVTFEGKRYYEVELQPLEIGKYKLLIPRKGFVPTRNKDGSHTGIGENNDC